MSEQERLNKQAIRLLVKVLWEAMWGDEEIDFFDLERSLDPETETKTLSLKYKPRQKDNAE